MSAPTYSVYSNLMANINAGIASSFGQAAAGMSGYVIPIALVMLGVSMLIYCIMIMTGKSQSSLNDSMWKIFAIVVILQATGAYYGSWVSAPLFALPDSLAAAVSGATSSTTALDALSNNLDQLIMGMAQAMISAFSALNFGGGMMLLTCIVLVALAGSLLEIACVFNMIYAKIGLALLLGVGPFFIVMLLWPVMRGYFFSWLNTVLYFVFLSVMSTMIMVLFINIANTFMGKLAVAIAGQSATQQNLAQSVYTMLVSAMSGSPSSAGVGGAVGAQVSANLNILSISLQMVFVFVPMFLVAIEMRSMISSMTSGSGGSFGTGVANIASMMFRAGLRPGGGK